jgi:D-ribulokinase
MASDPVAAVRGLDDLIVVPEFLGNRSPFADPQARAVISGLGLDHGIDSLVRLYLAGLCGIGYGLRQLLDRFTDRGITISTLIASGGAAQSDLACQMLADSTGISVGLPVSPEPVLLGSAMLAAIASKVHPDASSAMTAMSGHAQLFQPAGGDLARLHLARYQAFTALQSAARNLRTTVLASAIRADV